MLTYLLIQSPVLNEKKVVPTSNVAAPERDHHKRDKPVTTGKAGGGWDGDSRRRQSVEGEGRWSRSRSKSMGERTSPNDRRGRDDARKRGDSRGVPTSPVLDYLVSNWSDVPPL